MTFLRAENIIKKYAAHTALNDVSIDIPPQSIFGLLGPNGAGKTTLIRIITQIIEPDSGQVYIKGEKLNPNHTKLIGYLPEERGLYKKMKIGEHLLYLGQLRGLSKPEAKEKIRKWLKRFDLTTWWDKNIEDLSKGMQQKVQFIATVLHDPELLILDEPFSGFDPVNANILKDEILNLKEQGCTIIFSTHRMESVEELCDEIALINHSKKMLQGHKSDIKEQFKTHTFLLEHTQPIQSVADAFEVTDSSDLPGQPTLSTIKVLNGLSTNALLQQLMLQTDIKSFKERIPSINEIFISQVNQKQHA